MLSRIYFLFRTVSGPKSRVPWGRDGLLPCGGEGLLLMGLGVFGDNLVGGGFDHRIDSMVAGFGSVVGIGHVFVAARVDFIHQEVDLGWLELAAGDAPHFVHHIVREGIDFVKALKISSREAASALLADVEAVLTGY